MSDDNATDGMPGDEAKANLAYEATSLGMKEANKLAKRADRFTEATRQLSIRGSESGRQPEIEDAYIMSGLSALDYRLQEVAVLLRCLVSLQLKDDPRTLVSQDEVKAFKAAATGLNVLKTDVTIESLDTLMEDLDKALTGLFAEAGMDIPAGLVEQMASDLREDMQEEALADAQAEANPSPS